jgi:hypothetical protein
MKFLHACAIVVASLCLGACGGGDGGGPDGDQTSSFSGTYTEGPTSHVCQSRSSMDMCLAGDCSQCQCLTGCPAGPGEPIVLACVMYPVGQRPDVVYVGHVPQTGCRQAISPSGTTLVCDGDTMYALDGAGHTRADVMARGAMFQGQGNVSLGGSSLSCTRPRFGPGTTG